MGGLSIWHILVFTLVALAFSAVIVWIARIGKALLRKLDKPKSGKKWEEVGEDRIPF